MKLAGTSFVSTLLALSIASTCAMAATSSANTEVRQQLAAAVTGETGANQLEVPGQILRTGINLNTQTLSQNSQQLADLIKLTPVLKRIDKLRAICRACGPTPTLESLAARQDLFEAEQDAHQIIQRVNLAVDYVIAEVNAEQAVYAEILVNFQSTANKWVQRSNWASYYSNGALWAVAEALDIPTWKRPKYSISSGICGIIAGVIPSMFSLYAMHAAGGPKKTSEKDPNMLAELFCLAPTAEVQYPVPVWDYLSATPPGDKKSRRDQLIDRWVADKNLPKFTDRNDKGQVELVSAYVNEPKALNIDLLQTRTAMLTQLSSEVMKMKRMLYELTLAIDGMKHPAIADKEPERVL